MVMVITALVGAIGSLLAAIPPFMACVGMWRSGRGRHRRQKPSGPDNKRPGHESNAGPIA